MDKKFKSKEEIKDYLDSEQAQDEKYEQVLSNSYFFGQFMVMHIILKILKVKGHKETVAFIKKKYVDIGKTHPNYIIQAGKSDDLIKKYYEDSMSEKF